MAWFPVFGVSDVLVSVRSVREFYDEGLDFWAVCARILRHSILGRSVREFYDMGNVQALTVMRRN